MPHSKTRRGPLALLALVSLALLTATGCQNTQTTKIPSTGTDPLNGGVGLDGSYDPCGGDPDCDPCWYHPEDCSNPPLTHEWPKKPAKKKTAAKSKDLAKEWNTWKQNKVISNQEYVIAKGKYDLHMKEKPSKFWNPTKYGAWELTRKKLEEKMKTLGAAQGPG